MVRYPTPLVNGAMHSLCPLPCRDNFVISTEGASSRKLSSVAEVSLATTTFSDLVCGASSTVKGIGALRHWLVKEFVKNGNFGGSEAKPPFCFLKKPYRALKRRKEGSYSSCCF